MGAGADDVLGGLPVQREHAREEFLASLELRKAEMDVLRGRNAGRVLGIS
jgi:hypothetical protein